MTAEDELETMFGLRSLVAHLESIESVRDVQLAARPGASIGEMLSWERANYPAQLPAELKAFLALCDGLSLTWSVEHMGDELRIGCLHINELKRIARADVEQAEIGIESAQSHSGAGGRSAQLGLVGVGDGHMAFDLDSTVLDGRLCLFYRLPATDSPQVWFQDLSRCWFFVAETFADYLRLLVVHLGLPRWQYVYSEVGLDPAAKYWIRLFAPHRLELQDEGEPEGDARRRSYSRQPGQVW